VVNDILTDEISICLHLNFLVPSLSRSLHKYVKKSYLHVLLFITVYFYFYYIMCTGSYIHGHCCTTAIPSKMIQFYGTFYNWVLYTLCIETNIAVWCSLPQNNMLTVHNIKYFSWMNVWNSFWSTQHLAKCIQKLRFMFSCIDGKHQILIC